MFTGLSLLNLDAKGRLSMPTRYRDALTKTAAGQLTITRDPHGYLMIYARPQWEIFCQHVSSLPSNAQWWKRFFLGHATEVEMDATGRILIAPELRLGAGLSKEVLLIGMSSHFELWDKAKYDAEEAQAIAAEPPEAVKNLVY